jgi:lysyl-tRNA synthetase class 2
MRPLETLRQIRLNKLEKIKKLGIDPYPAKSVSREEIEEIRKKDLGTGIKVAGRMLAWREHGEITFADLKDASGQVQLVFKSEALPENQRELLGLLDLGDFIGVEGTLFETRAGELSVEVSDLKLLAKSLRPLPEKREGLKDTETRYRQRYLDLLVNPEIKEVFNKRTQIIQELRAYLDRHGFVEVETPILQPLYGGASARPFITHHNALDSDFYLRISDELYLKRLIVGGFEKVYEIGKDFRNEGIDRQHNPEFTMLEFYWAYADYEDLMKLTEEMLTGVIESVTGSLKIRYGDLVLDFTPPWRRITFRDLLFKELGIDVNTADTEEKLQREIEKKNIKLDLKGVVGYGALVDYLYKESCRPKIVQPTLLLDHPAAMMALAKRKNEDPSKISSFQLLVKGFEVIKAYNELNNPIEQRLRWEEEAKLAREGLAEHQALDEDYIRALEYGMPPTAGWGMGIARFVALLINQASIKDVILFPPLRP